ncbi:MAG: hypothetical protein ACJ8AI_23740, partial [Rhodopila sp.]
SAGVAGMLYTSPSHSEDAPRWRILCPVSADRAPDRREPLLARLNGVLGGVLAPESFTLSQSYYFGSVNSNPSHRVELIDGAYLDERNDLDTGAIGRPVKERPAQRPISSEGYEPIPDRRWNGYLATILDSLRRQAVDGQKHQQLWNHAVWLGGCYEQMGLSSKTAMDLLESCLPDTVECWDTARRTAGEGLLAGRKRPITLEDRDFRGTRRGAGNDHEFHPEQPEPTDEAGAQQTSDQSRGRQKAEEKPKDSRRKKWSNRQSADAAFKKAKELRLGGATYEETIAALAADPELGEWTRTKGRAADERELKHIWKKIVATGPIIRVEAGELDKATTEAENSLIAADLPIYQRGQSLVQPVTLEVAASHGRMTQTTCLGALNVHSLTDRMCGAAEYQKFDGRTEDFIRINPPAAVAQILLNRQGRWNFPTLAGVIATPSLRPDGSLLTAPGYDPATHIYHAVDATIQLDPAVYEPTREDAERALEDLQDLLVEFPFVDRPSQSVGLSQLITPVVRCAMPSAPMHLSQAPTPGSGKSFLADLSSHIYAGRPCPVVRATEDPKEMEKALSGAILAGFPLISLDNINGEIGSDLLCQVVERPLVQVRMFGTLDLAEVTSIATIFANGNNGFVRGDLVRRTIRASLDAQMERPELREFQGDPVQRILANRGRYVSACLLICRGYIVAGMPNKPPPLLSFTAWSDLVRGALMWLGAADPVTTMEAARQDDPVLTSLAEMLTAWDATIGSFQLTVSEVAMRLEWQGYEQLRDTAIRLFGRRGELDTQRLGLWLKKFEGRPVDGKRFLRAGKAHGGVTKWTVQTL